MLEACIFDLDGVIVDTAKYHYLSWKRLANQLGFEFSLEENEHLKGVSRMASLEFVLQCGGIQLPNARKEEFAALKNQWYLEYIHGMSSEEILPGTVEIISELKKNGVKIAIGSGSKNASSVLERIGLTEVFDAIVDGRHISKGKPDPEVFIKAAEALNVEPVNTVVFEDSYHGISAALAAGFLTIGIGKAHDLAAAHEVYGGLDQIEYQLLKNLVIEHRPQKSH